MEKLEAKFEAKETIYVPIHKLHGIPVSVQIQQQILFIESDTFCDENGDSISLYRKPVKSVKEAIDIIKNLHLYNALGMFVKDIPDATVSVWADMFEDCKHIEMVGDMCCVCHSPHIRTTTGCGHTICITCVHQIPKKHCCRDDTYEIPCPMCREDIMGNWSSN